MIYQKQKQAESTKTQSTKPLAFLESRIRFSISLAEVPSAHTFSAATKEAQSLTLLATLNLEFQDLAYALALLGGMSRNLRRKLFDNRAILSHPEYPALRLSGPKAEAEANIWEWVKQANPDQPATKEKTTNIIAIVKRASASSYEVAASTSARNAKAELKEKKAEAKALQKEIAEAVLAGTIEFTPEAEQSLAMIKELLKGDNLAICGDKPRAEIVSWLKKAATKESIELASLIAGAFDPFISQQTCTELDSFDTSPKAESGNPSRKLSALEIIQRRKEQRRSGIERRDETEQIEQVENNAKESLSSNLDLGLPEDL